MITLVRSTESATGSEKNVNTKGLIVRFFSAVWSGADGVRKVLHLALLLFLFIVFLGVLSGGVPPALPDKAALVIRPIGYLVEQLDGDPFDRAVAELAGDGKPQTLVQDVVDALTYAKDDDRIELVYLELSSVLGAGLSKLQHVAAAIEEFKSSGKRVVVSADFLSQQGYYLAAHGDEVYLHPDGLLILRGYGRFRHYYKDAIDLLRLDWNVFRVGTHKSFVEPYTRMDMSDEDRETTNRLINQIWTLYQLDVETARDLGDGAIAAFGNNYLENVSATGGDIAAAARDHGLVDELLTRTEVRDLLIDLVGADEDQPDTFNSAGMYDYLAQMRMLSGGKVKSENVAVVVAAGEILFGAQPPGTIGSDSTAELLRRARNDDSVKAIVLRVDSPGGGMFASEVIMDEIIALRGAGKPVVASMSSVAASGGYAISMVADRVMASPATITGSIGIFGMFPTYQRTLDAIGIATDGVGTTPWTGELRPDRAMSEHAKELFQLVINDGYDDFISDVAASRGMDKSEVDKIGQGQVWTGMDALNNGLIDELGGFEDAISAAAELAGLAEGEFGIKNIEHELSASEQLLVDMLGVAARAGVDLSYLAGQRTVIDKMAQEVADKTNSLLRFNDPKGVYAHCLCDIW
jgi:protease-4